MKSNLTSLIPLNEEELQSVAILALNRMLEMRRNNETDSAEIERLAEISRKVNQAAQNLQSRKEK